MMKEVFFDSLNDFFGDTEEDFYVADTFKLVSVIMVIDYMDDLEDMLEERIEEMSELLVVDIDVWKDLSEELFEMLWDKLESFE